MNCCDLGLSSGLETESPKNPENISFVHLVRKKRRRKKEKRRRKNTKNIAQYKGKNEAFVIHHNIEKTRVMTLATISSTTKIKYHND